MMKPVANAIRYTTVNVEKNSNPMRVTLIGQPGIGKPGNAYHIVKQSDGSYIWVESFLYERKGRMTIESGETSPAYARTPGGYGTPASFPTVMEAALAADRFVRRHRHVGVISSHVDPGAVNWRNEVNETWAEFQDLDQRFEF